MADLPTLKRRRFLLATGATVAIAGCTSDSDDDDDDDDEDETQTGAENGDEDGEESEDTPPAGDDHDYDVIPYDDVDVPTVPLEDALEWHEQETAHFVDARESEHSHENARISGSVWSPKPDGTDDDPVDDWTSDEPIVVYSEGPSESSPCVIRASRLIEDGYEYVYVLADGFSEWQSRDYPKD